MTSNSERPCQRRVCVEFLPLAELARPEVRALLRRHGVAPVVAARVIDRDPRVQAEADGALARVLADYRADARAGAFGTAPCVWPLLADEDGYWPSALSALRARARVRSFLDAALAAGAPLQPGDGVLLDLEPPLQVVRGRHPLAAALQLRQASRAGFVAGERELGALVLDLQRGGLRALATAYPMVAAGGWERLCVAPLRCGWDRVGLMIYSSMVAGYSRGALSLAAARRFGHLALRSLAQAHPGRAEAYVGVVGHGKLGDEPTHREPETLAAEVALARAAGVVAINAFCLEGILAQPRPEAWLEALAVSGAATASEPAAWSGDLAWTLTRALGRLL